MSFAKKLSELRAALKARSLDQAIREADSPTLRDELVLLAQRADER